MRKRMLYPLLTLWVMAVLLWAAAFAVEGPVALSLTVSDSGVTAGETVSVELSVTENPGVTGMELCLRYDPQLLSITEYTTENAAFDGILLEESQPGTLIVTVPPVTVEEGAEPVLHTATGLLVRITFQAMQEQSGETVISASANTEELNAPEVSCTLTIHAPQVHEHTPGEPVREDEIPATCQSDGSYALVVYCSDCGAELERETVTVPSTGEHEYTIEQERTEPSCTEDGYAIMACVCGDTMNVTLVATGHKEVTDPGCPATCTEPGLTDGVCCEYCGMVFTEKTEIPAAGHTEVTLSGYPATCTEYGLSDGLICSQCGVITLAQTQLPMTEHSYATVPAVAPTCTKSGWTEGTACTGCGAVETPQTEIPATGHTEIYVSAVPATCSSTGLKSGTKCAVCEETLSGREVVGKLPHTEETVPGTEPTCSDPGLTEGKRCTVCGEITVKQTEIPATAHTPEVIAAVEPSCAEVGWTEGSRCAVCEQILQEPEQLDRLPHTGQTLDGYPATCEKEGLTEGQICAVCGTVIQSQIPLTKLDHSYDHACDPDCNVCGGIRTSLQHSYSGWYVVSEATTEADGQRARTCIKCGLEEQQVIPMLQAEKEMGLAIALGYLVMIGAAAATLAAIRAKRAQAQQQEENEQQS